MSDDHAEPIELDLVEGDGWDGVEHLQAAMQLTPPGAVFSHLLGLMPGVRRHQAIRMLTNMLDLVATEPSIIASRISTEPRIRRLIWECAEGAQGAAYEGKIRALARAAAAVMDDAEQIDEAELLVGTLRSLEVVHVRALMRLEEWGHPTSEQEPDGRSLDLSEALGVPVGVAQRIAGDLLAQALARTTGIPFQTVTSKVVIAPLGERVLGILRGEQ